MDQRAIDVEEKQAFLHFHHVERDRNISYCSSANVQLSTSLLLAMRNSSSALHCARNNDLQCRRVHHEHCQHAPQKHK